MAYRIEFNQEKNQLLKAIRSVSFDDILAAIESGNLLADITNPSQKRTSQQLYVVRLGDYAYGVPYVIDDSRNVIFLKTAYPSRVLTRIYIKGGTDAQ